MPSITVSYFRSPLPQSPKLCIAHTRYEAYYVIPFGAEIAILGLACCSAFTLRMYLKRLNKGLAAAEEAESRPVDAYGEPVDRIPEDSTRMWKGFRYLY